MAKKNQVPPCCCRGFAGITPCPYVFVYCPGSTGELAWLADGWLIAYTQDVSGAARCVYQCATSSPLRQVAVSRADFGSSSFFRRTTVAAVLTTGTYAVRADTSASVVFECYGLYGATPVVLAGTLPSGTTLGGILYTRWARNKAEAISGHPGYAFPCEAEHP